MELPGGGEVDYHTAAMGNIAGMGEFSFSPEDNPQITAATSQLDYLANTDTAFEDRMAFTATTMPRHLDEAGLLAQLVSLSLSVCPSGCLSVRFCMLMLCLPVFYILACRNYFMHFPTWFLNFVFSNRLHHCMSKNHAYCNKLLHPSPTTCKTRPAGRVRPATRFCPARELFLNYNGNRPAACHRPPLHYTIEGLYQA